MINIVQIKFDVLDSANKTKISCMSSISAGAVVRDLSACNIRQQKKY